MNDLTTPRLALPLLQAGQAQKELSHNESLIRIDIAAQGAALAAGANLPPDDPAEGDCWILGDAPQNAWAGRAGHIASWTRAGWRFVEPCEGMRFWIVADRAFALFSQGRWAAGRSYGRLFVEGLQVVGPRAAAITEPTGGATVDAEARTSIASILEALRTHGLLGTP